MKIPILASEQATTSFVVVIFAVAPLGCLEFLQIKCARRACTLAQCSAYIFIFVRQKDQIKQDLHERKIVEKNRKGTEKPLCMTTGSPCPQLRRIQRFPNTYVVHFPTVIHLLFHVSCVIMHVFFLFGVVEISNTMEVDVDFGTYVGNVRIGVCIWMDLVHFLDVYTFIL